MACKQSWPERAAVKVAFTKLTTQQKIWKCHRHLVAMQCEIVPQVKMKLYPEFSAFCRYRGYSLPWRSLYNKGLAITSNILRLSNSKMYGKRITIKKPRYSGHILLLSSSRSHCITDRQIAEKCYKPRRITPSEDQHIILHIIRKQNPKIAKYSTPKANYRKQWIFVTADLYHKIFETAKPRSKLFSPYLP